MATITRDVTLQFFRSYPVNDCEIKRNDVTRKYHKITEASIGRMQNFVSDNDIEIECDFKYFTEIRFFSDKEVDEPEEDEQS